MKSVFRILPILGVLFAFNTMNAQSVQPSFSASNSGEMRLFFAIEDLTATQLQVLFMDKSGTVLFSEYVHDAASFERFYDLSEMPKGEYLLLVESGKATTVQPIQIGFKTLTIDTKLAERTTCASAHVEN